MGLLERRADRDQLIAVADRLRQVLRVGIAGAIERVAHGDPQPRRCQPGRQPVDRHDPPDMEHLVVVALWLEVGVVEGQLPAESLELAGDDDPIVHVEAPLDVAPPEPGRLDRPRAVLEDRDRPLDPAPERRLHPDIDDADAGADDGPLLHPGQLAQLPHLAQVVVATRQVEEQLANRVEAEPAPGPSQGVGRGKPGARDVGVEEGSRIGRRRWRRGRLRRTARRRSGHAPTRRR